MLLRSLLSLRYVRLFFLFTMNLDRLRLVWPKSRMHWVKNLCCNMMRACSGSFSLFLLSRKDSEDGWNFLSRYGEMRISYTPDSCRFKVSSGGVNCVGEDGLRVAGSFSEWFCLREEAEGV